MRYRNSPLGVKRRTALTKAAGFTLAELLVVVAILGLLFALILPAVQAARESARLLSCKNNMRQIALALHSHHDARKGFPAGVVVKDKGNCLNFESREGMNWLIAILPYIEEGPLYSKYDDRLFNQAPENDEFRKTFVSPYTCPADEFGGQKIIPALGRVAAVGKANLPYMSGSYRGVSGFSDGLFFSSYLDSDLAANYPLKRRGVLHAVGWGLPRFREERFKTILDGRSTTLMFGESATQTNPGRHTLWAYSFEFYTLSAVTTQSRTLDGDYDGCEAVSGMTGRELPCQRGWGGRHPRLLNFAFADASIVSVSNLIDTKVLAQMATIDGEEVIASR
jgi:prepilin-type N-terminal cleavage/methylation domain-containing protein